MQPISSLSTIIGRYDALLLDLWGVVHDGTHLYPGVHGVLEQLKAAGKKVIFVSNAPRRSSKVIAVLEKLGVDESLYMEAISSGEMGYQWLAQNIPSPFKGRGYYYIGPAKDADVLDGLDYTRVDDLKQADFLLNVGFGSEAQSTEDWMPLLRTAGAMQMPMLCLNPDLEVVKQTGERFACAGALAVSYEQMGGAVTWFGKPYREVYDYCFSILFPSPLAGEGRVGGNPHPGPLPKREREKILAIGDSLLTDIAGANQAGIDSVLVTGGILKKHSGEEIVRMCGELNAQPDYLMHHLAW